MMRTRNCGQLWKNAHFMPIGNLNGLEQKQGNIWLTLKTFIRPRGPETRRKVGRVLEKIGPQKCPHYAHTRISPTVCNSRKIDPPKRLLFGYFQLWVTTGKIGYATPVPNCGYMRRNANFMTTRTTVSNRWFLRQSNLVQLGRNATRFDKKNRGSWVHETGQRDTIPVGCAPHFATGFWK